MGKMRSAYKILIRKPERPLERHKHRWEHNIRMDQKGNTVGRYGLAAIVNMITNLRLP
jgi:hypothetical protein